MIAVVTVTGATTMDLESNALNAAASLWDGHKDRHQWYVGQSYSYRLAVVERPEPEVHWREELGLWEATLRVTTVKA